MASRKNTTNTPAASADETTSPDPDAVHKALEQVIFEATSEFARPFAAAIGTISVALRDFQDYSDDVDHDEVNVDVYKPLNAAGCFLRLEGVLRNLQPDEKVEFVRLIDQFRAEIANDDGDEEDVQHNPEAERLREKLAKRNARVAELKQQVEDHEHTASELYSLRKLATSREAEYEARIAELERKLKERDSDREDNEKKPSKSDKSHKSHGERDQEPDEHVASDSALKEELAWHRRQSGKTPPDFRSSTGNANDQAARTGERGANNADENENESDDIEGLDLFVDSAKLPKKQASSTKPPPSKSGFTQMPTPNSNGNGAQPGRTTRLSSKANIQPDLPKTKKPTKTGPRQRSTGVYGGTGYEEDDSPAWGIDDNDPEAILRRKPRKPTAKGSAIPENAATGRSEASGSNGTPPGQSSTDGSGRKQSKATNKASKTIKRKVSEADDKPASDVEEPRKSNPGKRSRGERSDQEDQPSTFKKPKRESTLQSIREEPETKGKHARATKGSSDISSAVKTKAPPSKQRKVAKTNSAEFDAGIFDLIDISPHEDTDSDIEDED